MTRPLLVANWKMHKTRAGVKDFIERFTGALDASRPADVVLCPAFVHLATAAGALGDAAVAVGAQDIFWEPGEGAFTGEISANMLHDLGVNHVIIGHSERRQILGEPDEWVARKVAAAAAAGLTVLLCVGEDEAQRQQGRTEAVVTAQLAAALTPLEPAQRQAVIVAYEPLWAIGSGRPSRPAEAAEVAALIRAWLAERGGRSQGQVVLYGGSVNAGNVGAYVAETTIDGALVGGASLDPEGFAALVEAAADASATLGDGVGEAGDD